jgi:hypothetical protein
MVPRISLALAIVVALTAHMTRVRQAAAIDTLFNKANSTWNTAGNWNQGGVPQANPFLEVGVVGTSASGGVVDGVANITAPVTTQSGGLVLGQTAGSTGTLNISGTGTLTNVVYTPALPASPTPGTAIIGAAGRGYLNVSGGTFAAVNMTVGGEDIATGSGRSAVNLSGSTTLNLGSATLGRNLKITGPSVNFNVTGSATLQETNAYTAVITSPTAHSPIKAAGGAILNGTLAIEFSGVPAPAAGQTWNLVDAFSITGGFSNIGTGDVAVTGAPAPALGSAFRVKQVNGGTNGQLLQLSLEKLLVLTVDRDSGNLSIRNPLGGAISIDGYAVYSPTAGSLKTSYAGIGTGTPAAGTWIKPTNAASQPLNTKNALSEFIQPDFTPPIVNDVYNLTSVPSVPLGNGFDKFAVISNTPDIGLNGEDLVFEYTSPTLGTVRGQVEYIGTAFENNLVLTVDAATGVASLKNDTNKSLSFDGYSILSSTGNLTGGAPWTGIGGTWEKSPATTTSLTETNPHGPLVLAQGQTIAIGDISSTGFTTAAQRSGLTLQFIRAGGALEGDFNLDGKVDAADYTTWRDGLGTTTTLGQYATWKANFGLSGGGTEDEVFRAGTVRFTNIPGAGGGALALSPVPEPATAWLLVAGLGATLGWRRGRRVSTDKSQCESSEVIPQQGQEGATNMSKRFMAFGLATLAVCAVTWMAEPAAAQVQGITVLNHKFEQLNPPTADTKVVPFDAAGTPIAPDQPMGIPGWTFSGPGTEVFFNGATPTIMGDSSTEGNGFAGRRLTLADPDGTVFQTTSHNGLNIPAAQSYRLSFKALDAYTINGVSTSNVTEFNGRGQITARLFYGASKTTIVEQAFDLNDTSNTHQWTDFVLTAPGGSAGVLAAVGQPIGIEFNTTSIARNAGNPTFPVNHSWVSVDNVLLQIAGTTAGDLNGDGLVNITDYRIVRDAQQTSPKTYLFEGELTGDDVVNLNDFRAWTKAAPPIGAGGGSFSTGVPEPTTLALALIVAGASSFGFRRRTASPPTRHMLAVIAAALAGLLATASTSSATLLAFDPFKIGSNLAAGEYSTAPLGGQNPTIGPTAFFSGGWVAASAGQTISATGLNYKNGGTEGSGSINGNGNIGGRTGRALAAPLGEGAFANGTYYVSFMANYGTVAGGLDSNMGFRSVEFWPAGGTIGNDNGRTDIGYNQYNLHGQPTTQGSATTAKLYFNVNESGGDNVRGAIIPGAPDSYNNDGKVHLIVLKYVLTDVPDADSISLFLDPQNGIEPTPNVCFDGTGVVDVCGDNATVTPTALNLTLGAIGAMTNFGGGAPANAGFSDEYRIATTFAEAVPDFPVPGDTNHDLKVDILDYTAILQHMNLNGTLATGDVTGDGKVTIADYRLWKDNRTDMGAGAGSVNLSGPAVPEPSTIVMSLAGVLWVMHARRRVRCA